VGLFGAIFQKVAEVVSGKTQIDEELFEELEETLITVDVGVETSVQLVDKVRERTKKEKLSSAEELQEVLKEEIALLLSEGIINWM
jgi:fused signal recognition particle receptor